MIELLLLGFILAIFAMAYYTRDDKQEYGDRSKHRQNSADHEDLCQ